MKSPLRLGLPKGRMQDGVLDLMRSAGLPVRIDSRDYRPTLAQNGWEVKILKPQNIVEMLHQGSRDLGFAGADWVSELDRDLVELLDTGLDPVRLVVAAPKALLVDGLLPRTKLRVATEYTGLARTWIAKRNLDAQVVRTYGATEVFPPEDADIIIDNTATGSTLRANQLTIIDEVMRSSTRLYTQARALEDVGKRTRIEEYTMLLRSVLDARNRVLVEANVPANQLEAIAALLPCMREPTIAPLHGGLGYAIRAAIPKGSLPEVIPAIRQLGGTDIVVSQPSQIIP